MRNTLLLFIPLPPPVHGSNIINSYVVDNLFLRDKYDVRVVPLHYATTNEDIGKRPFLKLLKACKYCAELARLDFKADIAYFVPALTGLPFYRDFVLCSLLKKKAEKLIIHLHGKGIRDKTKVHAIRIAYRYFFTGTYVIHLSSLLLSDLHGIADGITKIYSLPNGVEVGRAVYCNRGKVDKGVSLLFLSNLYRDKGLLTILDACKILKSINRQFVLNIIGNATRDLASPQLQSEIEIRKLEGSVLYHGPSYGERKYAVLEKADVFVFPTGYKKECFPLVIIEAMAFCLPVISTNEGAIPEIVENGKTGFVIAKNNPEALADKLDLLINNPALRRRMGRMGRQKYERKYTLKRFNESFVRIVDAIAEDEV